MKDTMRFGISPWGPEPHRAGRRTPPAPRAQFVDTEDDAGTSPPLIDPLDDREGRG
jgi:hypothetical protein